MIRKFNNNIITSFTNPIFNLDTFNSTGETILKTIGVSKGDIPTDSASGRTLSISMLANKPITNASTYVFKFYINSAETLTNAVSFAGITTSSADTTPYLVRTFWIRGTADDQGLLDSVGINLNLYNDRGDFTDPLSSFGPPIYSPETRDVYFLLTGRRTSATSDTVRIRYFSLEL